MSSAVYNHLCNFGRGHYGEHSCEIILNLDQLFGRCLLKFTDDRLTGHARGEGGGTPHFSSYVGSGPASTLHPIDISGISFSQKKVFKILATPRNIPNSVP